MVTATAVKPSFITTTNLKKLRPKYRSSFHSFYYMKKEVLDVCSGGRIFRFDKHNPPTLYVDNRSFGLTKFSNGQNKAAYLSDTK